MLVVISPPTRRGHVHRQCFRAEVDLTTGPTDHRHQTLNSQPCHNYLLFLHKCSNKNKYIKLLTRKPSKGADGHRHQHAQLWQVSEVQKPRDLDLVSGQGHISMHNTCRTTNLPNHVSVVSLSRTKIWPFKFREISTFREV